MLPAMANDTWEKEVVHLDVNLYSGCQNGPQDWSLEQKCTHCLE